MTQRKFVVTAAVIAILGTIAVVYLLTKPSSNIGGIVKNGDLNMDQQLNGKIIDRAISEGNPNICDEINGEAPFPQLGPVDEFLGYRLFEEKESIRNCKVYATQGAYPGP